MDRRQSTAMAAARSLVVNRTLAAAILCGVPVLCPGCATKSFVEEQVRAAETRLNQQAAATESRLTSRLDAQETSPAVPARVTPRGGVEGDARKNRPRERALTEFLRSLSPRDLAGN